MPIFLPEQRLINEKWIIKPFKGLTIQEWPNLYASYYCIGADSSGGADSTLESALDPALVISGIAPESAPEKLES